MPEVTSYSMRDEIIYSTAHLNVIYASLFFFMSDWISLLVNFWPDEKNGNELECPRFPSFCSQSSGEWYSSPFCATWSVGQTYDSLLMLKMSFIWDKMWVNSSLSWSKELKAVILSSSLLAKCQRYWLSKRWTNIDIMNGRNISQYPRHWSIWDIQPTISNFATVCQLAVIRAL